MIGLGKWGCHVETMFFSGDVELTVKDNNGEYDFEVVLPGIDVPSYEVKDIEEDDDTITATIYVPDINKDAELNVTFDGDTFSGYLKIPFLGKIKFKDGYKIN